ncbi:hypothetical protein SCLCIDRAFT_747739 [Scleroderma citrinum Foug A]|uniref:Uncharacterized protein n=1 Tax=Scleroderma citrinum Foug A TaxID=1036808 RepID=A0A0C3D394_9AGAM|nr:hypothetical protein SCLCIDRAFT_747739 [Scleroderma citrinum Foug A]
MSTTENSLQRLTFASSCKKDHAARPFDVRGHKSVDQVDIMRMSCLVHACDETGEIYKRVLQVPFRLSVMRRTKFCDNDDSFSLMSVAPSRKVFGSMLRFEVWLVGEDATSSSSRSPGVYTYPGLYESLGLRIASFQALLEIGSPESSSSQSLLHSIWWSSQRSNWNKAVADGKHPVCSLLRPSRWNQMCLSIGTEIEIMVIAGFQKQRLRISSCNNCKQGDIYAQINTCADTSHLRKTTAY